ncbi:MAG: hypothetical protein IT449_09040 [Phycisphaerales bacterium]|nr:hypothetical protein [Phycisphaerales bacterium]
MGFASGAVTFRRFFIVGEHPQRLGKTWLDALHAHAFGRHQTLSRDGVEFGWIKPTHLFDADFTAPQRLEVGRFVHLGLRIDRTAPPPAIVRSYRMMEEASRLADSGKLFLTRSEKKDAKESALARAEEEAKGGAFRRVSAAPVLLDLEDGVIYFGNTGSASADRLISLCADTFDVSLVPATAEEVAFRFAQRAGLSRAFEDVAADPLSEPPAMGAGIDGASMNGHDRGFLGREFLTHLWRLRDQEEGLCPAGGERSIEFALHTSMQLECEWGVAGRVAIRADAPASAPEARLALASGKLPVRAGIMLALGGEEFSFSLNGPAWTVSGLQLPRSQERDPAAALEERFMSLRDTARTLDAMFEALLRLRLDAGWKSQWNAIRRWAQERSAPPTAAPRRASA